MPRPKSYNPRNISKNYGKMGNKRGRPRKDYKPTPDPALKIKHRKVLITFD